MVRALKIISTTNSIPEKEREIYADVLRIVLVVIVIMGFVLPQFEDLFAQMESLPIATRILMAISDFVAHKWYLLIFFGIIGFIIIKVIFSIPAVKLWKDWLELHLPKIGKLRKIVYTARFARTLSSLYSAGIPIITCLQIAKTTIGNSYIEGQFDDMIASVKGGAPLSREALTVLTALLRN